jgi:hypothetical protein
MTALLVPARSLIGRGGDVGCTLSILFSRVRPVRCITALGAPCCNRLDALFSAGPERFLLILALKR